MTRPFAILLLTGAALWWTGCSKPPADQAKKEAAPAPDYFQVDPATAGSVQGSIRFEGKRPAPKRISMDAEEACEAMHKDAPVFDQQLLVAKDGGLANVFVYVKSGLEGKQFAPPAEAVMIEQRGCQFIPRVVALRAGQTLAVKNSDPVSHNIHPMPKNNRDWNQQQPPDAPDLKRRFAYPEVMIPVKCNVHAWMKSYIAVLEHPFFAITSDAGEFTIAGLPPGDYTVAAWHERFGERTETITVTPKQAANFAMVFR
jgi:plastocyanin